MISDREQALEEAILHAFLAAVEGERPCPFCEAATHHCYPFAEHDGCVAGGLLKQATPSGGQDG